MKQSIELTEEQFSFALKLLGAALSSRIKEKGRDSFINAHEILGATLVEVGELEEAVHRKVTLEVISELLDVAVGCVVGVASLNAHLQASIASGEKK